jgi:glycosyltransferase involved in cell wall biosynthesis
MITNTKDPRTVKHVLVLNQFAIPRSQSGATRHIEMFSLLSGWSPLIVAGNREHSSQKVYRSDDRRFKLAWVPTYTGAGLARMAGWAVYAAQATVIGLTRRHVDTVYASTPQMLVPVAGAIVATLRRTPLIVEVRDLWPESIIDAGALRRGSPTHRLLVRLERWVYRRADQIVVVTPGWEEHFAGLGVDLDKVHVVSNGTEVSDFTVDDDRDALRREFGLTGFTAIYAGAHGPANALDLLLDAAKALPAINVLLIGAGARKASLQERAQVEGLTNVEFRDPMTRIALARLLNGCDVGIHSIQPLPILAHGMSPNKLFDYMASGLPVVSNAAVALREIMIDGDCGHTGGPESLGACLNQVYEATPEQRVKWGDRGREIVSERFSRRAAAQKLASVLESSLVHS